MRHNGQELALLRIDDRLIHGQVVVKWLRYLGCNEVVIVDDELAKDRDLQAVLRLAAPRSVRLHIASVDQAAGVLEHVQPCGSCAGSDCGAGRSLRGAPCPEIGNRNRRILVLVKTPQAAVALLDHGVIFSELNVGGLAGGRGARRVYRSISVTEGQLEMLRDISSRGVRVYFQTVPEERAVELSEVSSVRETAG